jgi:hypothetical protein
VHKVSLLFFWKTSIVDTNNLKRQYVMLNIFSQWIRSKEEITDLGERRNAVVTDTFL